MADPAVELERRVAAAIAAALPDHAGADAVVRPAGNPRFGDYQANAAMALGKALGRPPREVAADIVEHLDLEGIADPAEVAGPGFVNLRLTEAWLSAQATALLEDDRVGVVAADGPERVVVDYSSPNVAKEMHVGHLRSTVIGDAVCRLLGFLGHDVVRQNHVGDWGTQFGMLIEHLLDVGMTEDLSIGDLNAFYQQAREKFETDADFAERARRRVVLLQSADESTMRLWRLFMDESIRHMDEVYRRLGVLLTDHDLAGESVYNDDLGPTCDELVALGIATVSDGALCVFPPGFTGREGGPMPVMLRKSDGGYGYDATDVAALRHRVKDLGGRLLVYVVGAPQGQHLALVFAVGEMAGWLGPGRSRAVHASFGSVLGPDGRVLRTRSGEPPKLVDLLDEATARALAIVSSSSPDLPEQEQAAVAEAVGIGGIKYADLSVDRIKDYVFDFDRMLAMDGNTAAYLQYATARCRSILRKAGGPPGSTIEIAEPAERALVLKLLQLDGAVRAAAEHLQPHRLCGHLFDLAKAFTSFFDACPVLKASTPEQRLSRLALVDLTSRALVLGLDLVGITAPERM
jgi:arginyl-tRNA synthetase